MSLKRAESKQCRLVKKYDFKQAGAVTKSSQKRNFKVQQIQWVKLYKNSEQSSHQKSILMHLKMKINIQRIFSKARFKKPRSFTANLRLQCRFMTEQCQRRLLKYLLYVKCKVFKMLNSLFHFYFIRSNYFTFSYRNKIHEIFYSMII